MGKRLESAEPAGPDRQLPEEPYGVRSAIGRPEWGQELWEFPEAVLLVDAGERVSWANAAAAALTGWAPEELVGLALDALLDPEERAQIAQARALPDLKGPVRYHCTLLARNGEPREVSVSVGPAGEHGSVYLLRDLARQRTVERQLGTELAESRALAAFGRQVAGLMHDLRHASNLLGLTVRNLLHHHADPAFHRDALRTLEAVAAQMAGLVCRLSRPSRAALTRRLTVIGDLVRQALELLASAGKQAEVAATLLQGLDQGLAWEVDGPEMLRVVFNLLLNAYESIREGGQVTVRAEADRDRRWARLVIEDTGPGLPPEFLASELFRPFRSTKPGGLGLGLFQAKAIVEAHGGSLEVANREDRRGARVTVSLPAASGAAPSRA